jgi:hypothetical protein
MATESEITELVRKMKRGVNYSVIGKGLLIDLLAKYCTATLSNAR